MKRIPLRARDGSVRAHALVDDEDFEWLNQWRWHVQTKSAKHRTLYVARSEHISYIAGRQTVRCVQMHVAIMGAPGVDHQNGNGLDNRRCNLRRADQRKNAQNQQKRSGTRGVTRCGNRWAARAMVEGKAHRLGSYDSIEAADAVVKAFRAEHMPFSEDARAAS